MSTHTSDTRTDFIRGFESTTGLHAPEVDRQWDAFSYMLSNEEIERIESGGFQAGADCGKQFNEVYGLATSSCL